MAENSEKIYPICEDICIFVAFKLLTERTTKNEHLSSIYTYA